MTFFVTRDGKKIDEFEKAEFHAKIFTGDILTTDHYWAEGMSDWEPVADYTIGMQTMKMDLSSEEKQLAAKPAGALAKLTSWIKRGK